MNVLSMGKQGLPDKFLIYSVENLAIDSVPEILSKNQLNKSILFFFIFLYHYKTNNENPQIIYKQDKYSFQK